MKTSEKETNGWSGWVMLCVLIISGIALGILFIWLVKRPGGPPAWPLIGASLHPAHRSVVAGGEPLSEVVAGVHRRIGREHPIRRAEAELREVFMRLGFEVATGDLVLYTDADLPFDMAELPRAVRLLREYDVDIISAYRFDRTGEGLLRGVYTWVYNGLIKALFGVKVRDINFAFKLCRSRIFDHVELKSEGSFIDAELVIRSTRLGYEINSGTLTEQS